MQSGTVSIKMKKAGFALFGLTILGTALFLWLAKAPVMGAFLTDKLKIPVSLGSINLSPRQATLRRFAIINPHGFRMPTAFRSDQIQINYEVKKLLSHPAEIDSIYLSDNLISIEMSNALGLENNWKVIGVNMHKPIRHSKAVLIHKLILLDTKVEILGLGLPNTVIVKQVDRMVFNEIDSVDGFPTKQLIQQIFQSSGIQEYIENAFSIPEKVLPKRFPYNWF